MQVGDRVYAEDVKTKEQGIKEVKTVYRHETDTLIHLTIAGEEIVTTDTHPFFVEGKGWVEAGSLKAEDKVYDSTNDTLEIEKLELEKLDEPIIVYNFEVEDYHTYYVGEHTILVHNSCAKPTVGQGSSNQTTSGFKEWLNKGERNNKVYFGVQDGEEVYTGITKQTTKARLSQHNSTGKDFQDLWMQHEGLTRNQARAIEQYYIENGPNKYNKINSISTKNKYYKDAKEWAIEYLKD